jgi:hypothetical protein
MHLKASFISLLWLQIKVYHEMKLLIAEKRFQNIKNLRFVLPWICMLLGRALKKAVLVSESINSVMHALVSLTRCTILILPYASVSVLLEMKQTGNATITA